MSVQVYGQVHDYSSFPLITREVCKFLRKRTQLSFWPANAVFDKVDAPWAQVLDNSAQIGVYVGYPSAGLNWLINHPKKWIFTVCETDAIPVEWVEVLRRMDRIFVPSQFCKEVFDRYNVGEVTVIRHGISPAVSTPTKPFDGAIWWEGSSDCLKVLHVSGAASFPQRKGTPQLLVAWKRFLEINPVAILTLKMSRNPGIVRVIEELGIQNNVEIDDSPTLPQHKMVDYISAFDFVVQPSRGEGFGLVGLESKFAGVPIVITPITGHEEYMTVGVDTLIKTGMPAQLTTQGNDMGSAPEVRADSIVEAMLDCSKNLAQRTEATVAWAQSNKIKWLWSNVLRPLDRMLKLDLDGTRQKIKLGAGSRGF